MVGMDTDMQLQLLCPNCEHRWQLEVEDAWFVEISIHEDICPICEHQGDPVDIGYEREPLHLMGIESRAS